MKSVNRIDDQMKKDLNLNGANMDLQNQIYQVNYILLNYFKSWPYYLYWCLKKLGKRNVKHKVSDFFDGLWWGSCVPNRNGPSLGAVSTVHRQHRHHVHVDSLCPRIPDRRIRLWRPRGYHQQTHQCCQKRRSAQ